MENTLDINPQQPIVDKKFKITENAIVGVEKKLGLATETDRVIEASLFIDKPLLDAALIIGQPPQPERIFGDIAWANYLDARSYAREYGNQPLTVDFIRELHKKLAKRRGPHLGGTIRNIDARSLSPLELNQDQIRIVEENPFLTFERMAVDDHQRTTGHIVYPSGQNTYELLINANGEIRN